jgi:dual specificity phosphatase 12
MPEVPIFEEYAATVVVEGDKSEKQEEELLAPKHYYTCKKCRTQLCQQSDVIEHQFLPAEENHGKKEEGQTVAIESTNQCSVFLHPVPWLKDQVQTDFEGKIKCPKCADKIGSYSWKGIACSCGY